MAKSIKKCVSTVLAAVMCLSVILSAFSALSLNINAENDSHTYSANNFTALPEDWGLLEGSDAKNTKNPTFADGNITLWHDNPSDGSVVGPYWGTVYEVAMGQEWSDFTFKMDFKVEKQNNNGRFINVMFHTQKDEYMSAYGFLHRIDNRYNNAVHKPDGNSLDLDEKNSSGSVAFTAGATHTIIITMSGSMAKYYLDGVLLREWDVSKHYNDVGGARSGGGFALNINGCALTIYSLTITDKVLDLNAAPEAPASATYEAEAGLASYRADGTLTIKAKSELEVPSRYRVFWGNKDGKLSGYNAFQDITAQGITTTFDLMPNTFVPEGADRLLVYSFSSSSGKLSEECAVAMLDGKESNFGTAKTEVQIISDTHITSNSSHSYNKNFVAALNDINRVSPNTKGIFINGDIADGDMSNFDKPFADQYVLFKEIVANANLNGKVFVNAGNHEFFAWGSLGVNDERNENCIRQFLDGTGAEDVFYYKDIDGLRFIMLSSLECRNDNKAYLGEEQREWFEEAMATAPEGPIFVFLHQPLKNTVVSYEDEAIYSPDEAFLREILAQYPDTILFSGHSHERMELASTMYSKDGITAFGTSATAYICQNGAVAGEGSQGYYMYLYSDKIVIRGRDFTNGTWIPEAQFVIEADVFEEENTVGSETTIPENTDNKDVTETTDDLGNSDMSDTDTPKKVGGCKSAIGGTAVLLMATAVLGGVFIKKKRD